MVRTFPGISPRILSLGILPALLLAFVAPAGAAGPVLVSASELGASHAIEVIAAGPDRTVLRFEVGDFRLLPVTVDGQAWSTVAEDPAYQVPLTQFLRPRGLRKLDIPFPLVTARHIRIVQTGRDFAYGWSINEINVTTPTGTDTGTN